MLWWCHFTSWVGRSGGAGWGFALKNLINGSAFILVLFCFSAASLADTPQSLACAPPLVELSTASTLPLNEHQRILQRVRQHCEGTGTCTSQALVQVIRDSIESEAPVTRSWWHKSGAKFWPQRAMLFLAYGIASIVPGAIATYLVPGAIRACGFQVSGEAVTVIAVSISGMCATYFHLGGPFEDRVVPWINKIANRAFHPTQDDRMGQVWSQISPSDRAVQGQVNDQIVSLQQKLMRAGERVAHRQLAEAGRMYASTIYHLLARFRGLFAAIPEMREEVRAYLPELREISEEDRVVLIYEVIRQLYEKPADELKNLQITREELVHYGLKCMLAWFIGDAEMPAGSTLSSK